MYRPNGTQFFGSTTSKPAPREIEGCRNAQKARAGSSPCPTSCRTKFQNTLSSAPSSTPAARSTHTPIQINSPDAQLDLASHCPVSRLTPSYTQFHSHADLPSLKFCVTPCRSAKPSSGADPPSAPPALQEISAWQASQDPPAPR